MGRAWGRRLGCAVGVLAALGVAGVARGGVDRPEGAGRLIASWDFEERQTTLEPVPRNWFRSLHAPEAGSYRPGFPKYNLAAFDDAQAVSGGWSIKLPTHGGSTSLRLAGGVVATMPEGEVLVTAMVRTEGLVHARARIVGEFLDEKLSAIGGCRFVSEAVTTDGAWRPVGFSMRATESAAWVRLELQVLQPAQLTPPTPPAPRTPSADSPEADGGVGEHEVYREDVNGAAWFDDLRLYQVPQVRLRSQSPFNVVEGPARPELELRVLDLAGEALRGEIVVYAIDGTRVDRVEREVRADGRAVRWTPRLDRFGWYRATARILSDAGVAGGTACDLAWLSPGRGLAGASERRRFGVVVPDGEDERLDLLPEMVRALGTGSLFFEVWGREDRARARFASGRSARRTTVAEEIGGDVERLLEAVQDVTFVLDRAPEDLALKMRVDADHPLRVMGGEGSDWMESLAPLVTRFGERVRRWQVGTAGNDRAFFEDDVAGMVSGIHEALFRLVPRPIVVLAWGLSQSAGRVEGTAGSLTVWAPYTAPHGSIGSYARTWSREADVSVVLERAPVEAFGEAGSACDLAKRGVEAWASAGVDAAVIEMAWSWGDPSAGGPMPTSAFAVWRTLSEELSARRCVGTLPLGEGLRVLIGERRLGGATNETSGMLIAWDESAEPGEGVIRAYLGHGAVRVRDIYGNERTVSPVDGVHVIGLERSPLFIDGVDGRLLRFRAGLRFEPRFIETRAERHEVDLIVENPWDIPIEGMARLGERDGWEMSPRVLRFALSPGETARLPVSLTFGLNEAAGEVEMGAEVALQAERRYPVLDLPLGAELGLSGIDLTASYEFAGEGRGDVVVRIAVSNTGDQETSYEAFAMAPGFAAREAPVTRLGAGERVVRRFVFEGGAAALRGERIRVGLREIEGTGRLNEWIEVR